MAKIESSISGLEPLPGRNDAFHTPYAFLEARRKIDGAESLWRIGNNIYDLEAFSKYHPGGEEWIRLTKGTDITELFESHHLTDTATKLLPKYFIRKAVSSRSVPLTFKPDGFFHTFKKRALEALKHVDFHRPSKKSNAIADLLVTTTIILSLAAVFLQSYVVIIPAGIFLAWTAITAHNYFHMRDNFRMYYFDLSTMSSKEWRITHVMSHHTYPNTLWDYEMYVTEPLFQWLPDKRKSMIKGIISQLLSPLLWSALFYGQLIKRYYSVIFEYGKFEFRDAVPFLLPVLMTSLAPSVLFALKFWLLIIMSSSFVFSFIGFNAAHHHPDIFHDGDTSRSYLLITEMIYTCTHVIQFAEVLDLILFNPISFEFVKCVDLLSHFGNSVVVLLAQAGEGGFMLNIGFLEVPAKFAKFGFSLLVEFDLSRSRATGFFETFAKFFKFTSKVAALFLSFHARTTLSFDLKSSLICFCSLPTKDCSSSSLAVKDLLNQLYTREEIHSEVNELPNNTLFLIFLLLEYKHVMVEELLQFFVGEVDAKFFSLFFTTPLFEFHTTHVHDSSGDFVDVVLLFLGEAQHIESLLLSGIVGNQKFLAVIEARDCRLALRYKVVVIDVVGQQQHLCRRVEKKKFNKIENMRLEGVMRSPGMIVRFLRFDVSTSQFSRWTKVNTNEFTLFNRIVITDGLGITERFQYGVCLYNLILQGTFLLIRLISFLSRSTDGSEVRNYFLRILSLSSTRLTSDEHRLIFTSGFRILERAEDSLTLGAVIQGLGTAGYVVAVSDVAENPSVGRP
ncbi:Cytochrome b5-related protein [Dufourea novaeangliae]|uniref:Cytochrome b5-related protein n=1 Tax=Dufourea novaeangliae TaxID=178035 RepID=A0A154PUB2_DUFNO|nr:Cytochrome b5-related protein [Dufourea novaeangliae]